MVTEFASMLVLGAPSGCCAAIVSGQANSDITALLVAGAVALCPYEGALFSLTDGDKAMSVYLRGKEAARRACKGRMACKVRRCVGDSRRKRFRCCHKPCKQASCIGIVVRRMCQCMRFH